MVNLGSNEKLSEFFESVYVMIFYRKKIFELSSKKTPRKRDYVNSPPATEKDSSPGDFPSKNRFTECMAVGKRD